MTDRDEFLLDLRAEAHAALAAPPIERVSAALTVLPKLAEELDRQCLYRPELREVRHEMKTAITRFREEVRTAQKQHPEVTFRAAQVQSAFRDLERLLDKVDRLMDGAP